MIEGILLVKKARKYPNNSIRLIGHYRETDSGPAEISARRCITIYNFHLRCMLVGLLVVRLLIFHYTGARNHTSACQLVVPYVPT